MFLILVLTTISRSYGTIEKKTFYMVPKPAMVDPVHGMINEFTLSLTTTDETCTGNGQITMDIGNTEAGAAVKAFTPGTKPSWKLTTP